MREILAFPSVMIGAKSLPLFDVFGRLLGAQLRAGFQLWNILATFSGAMPARSFIAIHASQSIITRMMSSRGVEGMVIGRPVFRIP
jgi:hypothetical protein